MREREKEGKSERRREKGHSRSLYSPPRVQSRPDESQGSSGAVNKQKALICKQALSLSRVLFPLPFSALSVDRGGERARQIRSYFSCLGVGRVIGKG